MTWTRFVGCAFPHSRQSGGLPISSCVYLPKTTASFFYPTYGRWRWKSLFFQIYFKNQTPTLGTSFPKHLPLSTVLPLVIDSFTSATERHIEVCAASIFSIHLYRVYITYLSSTLLTFHGSVYLFAHVLFFFFPFFITGWRWAGNLCGTSKEQQLSSGSPKHPRDPGGNFQKRRRENLCDQERTEEGLKKGN